MTCKSVNFRFSKAMLLPSKSIAIGGQKDSFRSLKA